MFKIVLVLALMAAFVVSLPLNGDGSSQKDGPGKDVTHSGVPNVGSEKPSDEHKQPKRSVEAPPTQEEAKDQKKEEKPGNQTLHLDKRETDSKKSDGKPSNSESKSDTPAKPKRDVQWSNPQDPKSTQQTTQKEGLTHDSTKPAGDDTENKPKSKRAAVAEDKTNPNELKVPKVSKNPQTQ